MRVVAILTVIAIHTVPFHLPSSPLGERLEWFLMALFWSPIIAILLLRYARERTLMVAALGLYLAGLAGKALAWGRSKFQLTKKLVG